MRIDGCEIVISSSSGNLVVEGIVGQLKFKFLFGQCQIIPERFTNSIMFTSNLLYRMFECIGVKINNRNCHE